MSTAGPVSIFAFDAALLRATFEADQGDSPTLPSTLGPAGFVQSGPFR